MQVQRIKNNTSFKSTYRIPLVEQNISTAKREALKKFASKYQNVMYPNGNQGNVRVSIRKRLDFAFEQRLRQMGFKVFQRFDRHNVPKTKGKMDDYIKDALIKGEYHQFGKHKEGRSRWE